MTQYCRVLWLCTMVLLLSGCSNILSGLSDGPIKENYSKRTWGSFIDDQSIETKAKVNVKKASTSLAQSHISVVSYNGIVLIVGQVADLQNKQLASSVVKKIRKVRRVHNELSIAGPSNFLVRSSDNWLTSKTKVKMSFTPDIQSRRIKIVTENGVVYLLGLVTRKKANRIVKQVRENYGVQKIVKIFEYVDAGGVY